jgi:hypothetical protein
MRTFGDHSAVRPRVRPVELDVPPCGFLPRQRARQCTPTRGIPAVQQRVGQGVCESRRRGGIPDGVVEHLPKHGEVPGDEGPPRGQCLHCGQSEALLGRREGEGRRCGDQAGQLIVVHRAEDDRLDVEFGAPALEGRAVVPVIEQRLPARDDQPDIGKALAEVVLRGDQVDGALARLDPTDYEHVAGIRFGYRDLTADICA